MSEFLLEGRNQKVDDKSAYIEERQKLIDEMANEIRDLQSVISNIKVNFFFCDVDH